MTDRDASKHAGVARGGIDKGRLEALTDGILAVAMTILVLDIKFDGTEVISSDAHLIRHLLDVERTFSVYIVSFIVLGMYWVAHTLQFHYVRRVDRGMIWINLLFMLLVTTVPFTTSVMIDYEYLLIPIVMYGINQCLLAAMLFINISYLSRHPELAEPSLNADVVRFIHRRLVLFGGIPLVSIAVSFFNTRAALYLYLVMMLVHFFPERVDRIMRGSAADQRDPPA